MCPCSYYGICLTVVGNWERRKDNKVIRPYTVDLKYRGTRVPETDAALNDQVGTDKYWSNGPVYILIN